MQLRYGGFWHAVGECSFSIDRQVVENQHGRPYTYSETWNIDGEIIDSTPARVAARVVALERAYSTWYQDLTFYSATNVVLHRLRNAGSLSGVRVTTPPSFPSGGGAEGVTGRKYRIVVTADYALSGIIGEGGLPRDDEVVRSYTESLVITGGGPRREIVEVVSGVPILYTTHLETACRVVQSGSAVGFLRYPNFPALIWPDYHLGDPRRTMEGPRQGRNQTTEWPISWTYTYAAPTTLRAQPGNFYT